MQDTIDLLEAIGSDASLRHASSDELTKILEQTAAPEALTAAVASGDRASLAGEFGKGPMYSTQVSQGTFREEEEEGEGDEQKPGQEDETPKPAPVPDPGAPSLSQ